MILVIHERCDLLFAYMHSSALDRCQIRIIVHLSKKTSSRVKVATLLKVSHDP